MTTTADLLLTGQYLVTMDGQQRVIEEGGVAIAGDTILEVGKGGTARPLSSGQGHGRTRTLNHAGAHQRAYPCGHVALSWTGR